MQKEATLSHELVNLAMVVGEMIKRDIESGNNGPTYTQFKILYLIKRDVCHVGTISEVLEISQPATSIMVETMVKCGFLKRVPHPKDRRQIELHLTAKATSSLDMIYKRTFTRIDSRLSSLSNTRKKALGKNFREVFQLLSAVESSE